MLLPIFLACPAVDDTAAKDTGADDTADTAADSAGDTSAFDTDCFAQVMQSQAVCECAELSFDWSGLSKDSAGKAFGPSDVKVIHWYVFDMPVNTMNTALCAGGELGGQTFATSAAAGDVIDEGATSATVNVGDWSVQTGVIAFYDVDAADGADLWPRAAGVFTFDDSLSSNEVVIEGRGDVYTAP
ncbi:hypothetical protein LBMAG42_18630 [Deltaproteobacteria bacterium]|nr:hypothetical protein LBMAG42_18630 [Deltaproteobacteria bacterium]